MAQANMKIAEGNTLGKVQTTVVPMDFKGMVNYPRQVTDFLKSLASDGARATSPNKDDLEFARSRLEYWAKRVNNLELELIKRVNNLELELIKRCPHANISVDTSYLEGSYLDRASTIYTIKCADCGVKLFTWDEQHSYYG
jgi:hypothetical protein